MKNAPEVLYDDEQLIVFNKPAGLLSVPDRQDSELPSVRTWGMQEYPDFKIVHRLDKDTSGVMIAAKNAEIHRLLNESFSNREVHKTYLALIHGAPQSDKITIDEPIRSSAHGALMAIDSRGKPAITHLEVLQKYRGYSWLKLQPETGRTHQLRVHLAFLGNPIVADELYGDGKGFYVSSIKRRFNKPFDQDERPLLSRLALHAYSIEINHPADGSLLQFTAELPKDLRATLQQLDKWAL